MKDESNIILNGIAGYAVESEKDRKDVVDEIMIVADSMDSSSSRWIWG